MSTQLPPIPHQSPLSDQRGILSAIWADWFKQLFVRVGNNVEKSNTELSALLSTSTASEISNGYQKLPSGIYLQWGVTGSIASGVNSTITFPVAFPTACLQVIPGIKGNSAGVTTETGHFGAGNLTATTFDLFNRTSAAYTFSWFAVGH